MPRFTESAKRLFIALSKAELSWKTICKYIRVAQITAQCGDAKKEITGNVTETSLHLSALEK
jgi:hypothetical protein